MSARLTGLIIMASTITASSLQTQGRVAVQATGGYVTPVGALARYAGPGSAIGFSMTIPVTGRIALRMSREEHYLSGPAANARSGMRLVHYGAGLEAEVLNSGMRIAFDAAAGAHGFIASTPSGAVAPTPVLATSLGLQGGLRVGMHMTQRLSLYVAARAFVTMPNATQAAKLAEMGSGAAADFGSVITVPITAGFSLGL